MKRLSLTQYVGLAVFLAAVCLVLVAIQRPQISVGSAIDGQTYESTTTPSTAAATALKSKGGVFGSVVISKTDTGTMAFYDATTSDITLRNNIATSTLLVAFFPASPTVGTYVYDRTLNNGLLMVVTASAASTTVTWR